MRSLILSTGECVDKCAFGENYIGALNKCKGYCSNEDGIFYKDITTTDDEYTIYKCVTNCGINEYQIYGTKVCVTECPFYSSPNGICYKLCLNDPIYSFSAITNEGNKICSTGCLTDSDYKYYNKDKICVKQCSGLSNIINEENNECVSKCDINSEYKFLNEITINGEKEYHCKTSCVGDNKKYSLTDYICVDICKEPNVAVIDGKICSNKCNYNQFAVYNEITEEYHCTEGCDLTTDYKYYYKDDKICRNKCKDGDYYIDDGSNECISSCNQINNTNNQIYYYYEPIDNTLPKKCVLVCPPEKPYHNLYNYCSQSCNEGNYKYSLESNKTCMNNCPEGTYNDTFKCLTNCKINNKYFEGNQCLDSCENSLFGNNFFYESDSICIKQCRENDFIYKDHQ